MDKLNKKIKAYFIDLDGTLLDIKGKYAHSISKANLLALKQAKEEGQHIIISTGRSGKQATKYLNMVNCSYAVTGNGSIILKNNMVLKSIKISLRDSLSVIEFAKKNKLVLKVDDSRTAYGSFGVIQTYITKKMNFNPVKNFNLEMHKQYNKIVLWGKLKNKMIAIQKIMKKEFPNLSIVLMSKGYALEISDAKATKGMGNWFLAQKLNLKRDEIIHIGDSMNDSTVIPYMKLIAMKNSSNELKQMANYIGPDFKNGGVAKVLNGEYEENKNTKT